MKTITLYETTTGEQFSRLSDALTCELETEIQAIVNTHFACLCETEYLNNTKLAEAFFVFLLDGGNPSHLARDLKTLGSRVNAIQRVNALEPLDQVPTTFYTLKFDPHCCLDRVRAFWDMEFFDEEGEPVVEAFLTRHRINISTVWEQFSRWHQVYFGPEEKVQPGRNTFCGARGQFMEHASDYFYFSRGRRGAVIFLHADVLDRLTTRYATHS